MLNVETLETARLIATYLIEHPDACDSLDGIARWWLAPGATQRQSAVVDAVEVLRAQDLVEEVRATDGRVRYRRPAVRRAVDRRNADAIYRARVDAWRARCDPASP